MSAGQLFILSAPSGAGKTSLARALMRKIPDVEFSISHTTRQPRSGECDGEDYFFVSPTRFEEMINAGQFLEHARVYGNYYGTAGQAVNHQLDAGKQVLLDIDWQGARAVKQALPEAKSIFISPPSVAELEQRLRKRGLDKDQVIQRRMEQALAEMGHYEECDYIVINDDFDQALEQLIAIISDTMVDQRAMADMRDRVKGMVKQAQLLVNSSD